MRFLVTNDDGIDSDALLMLARVAQQFGDVRIVAPDSEQSSVSHSVTASRPLSYRRVARGAFDAFSVDGTPADCVSLGLYHWTGVDAVLSGINIGANVGDSLWHSGTVAAAKQAALLGVRGIALSARVARDTKHHTPLERAVYDVLTIVLAEQSVMLVNVNVPEQPREIVWTRQSTHRYNGRVVAASAVEPDRFRFHLDPMD